MGKGDMGEGHPQENLFGMKKGRESPTLELF